MHAQYLWHIARDRQDEDTAATQSSPIHVALTSRRAASNPLFMKIPTGILQHLDEVMDMVADRMQKSTIQIGRAHV